MCNKHYQMTGAPFSMNQEMALFLKAGSQSLFTTFSCKGFGGFEDRLCELLYVFF